MKSLPLTLFKLALAAVVVLAVVWLIGMEIPIVSVLLQIGLLAVAILFLFWLLWRFSQRFLWRVGRRLAFTLNIALTGIFVVLTAWAQS